MKSYEELMALFGAKNEQAFKEILEFRGLKYHSSGVYESAMNATDPKYLASLSTVYAERAKKTLQIVQTWVAILEDEATQLPKAPEAVDDVEILTADDVPTTEQMEEWARTLLFNRLMAQWGPRKVTGTSLEFIGACTVLELPQTPSVAEILNKLLN